MRARERESNIEGKREGKREGKKERERERERKREIETHTHTHTHTPSVQAIGLERESECIVCERQIYPSPIHASPCRMCTPERA